MSDVVYRPGQWQVVVEESGIAALPADAGADKVVALSEMLSRGVPELTEAIDVLSGGAITGLGSFAVALIGPNGTRFAVRGAVRVTTGFDSGFSGEDITTWSERFIAEPPRFEISFGEQAAEVEYPIRSGVVLASGVRIGEPFTAPQPEDIELGEPAATVAVDASSATDDDAEAESEPAPETDAEEAEHGPEAEAEPQPEPDAGAQSEAEPEPVGAEPAEAASPPMQGAEDEVLTDTVMPDDLPSAAVASDEAPSETITPDEIMLTRGVGAEQSDAADQPDPSATITPAEMPVPAPPAPDTVMTAPLDTPTPDPWSVQPPPLPAAGLDIGDHDGATISVAEARRLRGTTSAPDAPTEVMSALPGDLSSGASMRIRLSTGQVVELDRPVIIGRKPRSTRASGNSLPHLVAVESPSSDISRNHLEVRPEGDSVVVIDLHTTNGSTLLRPGADPVRLHPGEQTLVLGGDVIDVGDGVTVTVEELG
ncbi:FHA domain-containing protein [Microbacterium sp. NPDC058345]|uniref:FHA domain-containing protein n=1 Tax=Microbacterium sp. NPDC058345 TaxID=3346455 RepID=UPI00364B2EB9